MRHPTILFICASLTVLCFSIPALAYSGGTGEPNDPYQIAAQADWQQLMSTSAHWGKSFVLIADVNLAGVTVTPVGNLATKFTGSFDGNGCAIHNLTYTTTAVVNYAGLFGYTNGATIRDLGVDNVTVSTGGSYVGALVGYQNAGVILNCHSTGSAASNVSGCNNSYVGGLVGYQNSGTMVNCYSTGSVASTGSATNCSYSCAGGLVGYASYGTITDCYSAGSVTAAATQANSYAGGLAGRHDYSSIANCQSASSVTAISKYCNPFAGGLVGRQYYGSIANSCSTGSVTGSCTDAYEVPFAYVGGLVGSQQSGAVANCYSTGSVSSSVVYGCSYTAGLVGVLAVSGTITDCYSTGAVHSTSQCAYIGGLVASQGSTSNKIERCYSTGHVTTTGAVELYKGGLLGYRSAGTATATACFWDITTSGLTTSVGGSGVQGKSTADMKTLSTFTGWDFLGDSGGSADTWRMCADGVDYPRLTWEYVDDGDFACPDGVAMEDLARLANDWLADAQTPLYGADATGDSTVNFADFAAMAANWLRFENAILAMAAADAGYEQAVAWMGEQADILTTMATDPSAGSGTVNLPDSTATWTVTFEDYIGTSPVFKVATIGTCKSTRLFVDRLVMRSIGGWEMGKCRIPMSTLTDSPVVFSPSEVVKMPIHINKLNDTPDVKDIYIVGTPAFLKKVSMGESRYAGDVDKYSGVMDLFVEGISFDEPNVRIVDEASVQAKLDRFRASTKPEYIFTPAASANISIFPSYVTAHPAVQIEMYSGADTGEGMLRITNNCTVVGTKRTNPGTTWDYKVLPGSAGNSFTPYDVYAYHYRWDPADAATPAACKPITVPVTDTYVSQTFGEKQSQPGGQIFVTGDVVLGSDAYEMILAGKLTIVAQRSGASTDDGHIWIADSIYMAGPRYADDMPMPDNPNALGLVAQGVVKVIDPGMSYYAPNVRNMYPGPPPGPYLNTNGSTAKHFYVPVADPASTNIYNRKLPNPMVVEAAIAVGGGGFGAENVAVTIFGTTGNYGGRRENGETVPPPGSQTLQDSLVLRGSLCEVLRGIVGVVGTDGFSKQYYQDERLTGGILPGDIWFGGMYVPALPSQGQ